MMKIHLKPAALAELKSWAKEIAGCALVALVFYVLYIVL